MFKPMGSKGVKLKVFNLYLQVVKRFLPALWCIASRTLPDHLRGQEGSNDNRQRYILIPNHRKDYRRAPVI